ncbi:2OG-Fe(II) oxygenase superfamily protein [Coniochaeta sp. PMI_546]|nr:2OG-Fe(II) oxygenase superfamily protein [Coniochaeta sp. PMI_546]
MIMVAAAEIPVIDISDDANQLQVAKDLVEAAVEHGFIYIKNTGKDIPVDSVENAFNIAKVLFQAPLEDKQRCAIQPNNRGWSGMHIETLDPKNQRVGDYKEAFNFGQFVDGKPDQPIPSNIVPYEAQINAFQDHCYEMCLKINTLLGIGLNVQPPDFFTTRHLRENGASGTTLRLLYYPPLTATDASVEDVRAGAHSDYGSITMLFRLRGQAGLEVQTRDNTWAPVPVSPPGTENDPAPPVLVNIGDLLSYWTNGLLRSTVHRVVFPGPGKGVVDGETASEPRYSIAFFCHPVGTTQLTPVPSERVKNYVPPSDAGKAANPYSERKVLTADEHLQMRLRASYLQLYNDKE